MQPEQPEGGPGPVDEPAAAPAPAVPIAPVVPAVPMAPIAEAERIAELDVVRGFALLGILLMNVEYFARPIQGLMTGLDRSLEGVDLVAGWSIMAFVQGKFYSLFSMLFGMGFAIQMTRAAEGGGFGRRFVRRLLALAAIGAAHGYLIWAGDILLVYGLVGFVLLACFRKTPVARLPKWGLVLMFLPAFFMWVMLGLAQLAKLDPKASAEFAAQMDAQTTANAAEYAVAAEAYAHDSWVELLPRRATDMGLQLGYLPFIGASVLGLFVLGAWFVRSGAIVRPGEHLALFRRLFGFGLALGLPIAVAAMFAGAADGMTDFDLRFVAGTSMMAVANLLVALGYLSGLVLLVQRPAWRRRLRPLAAAGRMALTNYLLQSIVCTTLFYGYGFGLFGRVPRATQVLLVVAIWLGNLALSVWWLKRFRFGPAEWLWRSLTYGRAQPMRLERPAAAVG
jgi:uncharacterized protein